MDKEAVKRAYARWAPVYDKTFGMIADAGRKDAISIINRRRGSVLEVGVGTGVSLTRYGSHLDITGIDLSTDMLARARARVEAEGLSNIRGIHEMDAGDLTFNDESFDTVVAMYVMTIVEDPGKVLRELERVCAPGGEVILVNHFAEEKGFRALIERAMAPFSDIIGWHSDFKIDQIVGQAGLKLVETRRLAPLGLFTLVRFRKEPGAQGATAGDFADADATARAHRPLKPQPAANPAR